MNSLVHLNAALNYIEENLSGEIDFKEAAKLAYCSEYHFTRMFSFLAGVTLSEYIRRRRLTLAAFDLQDPRVKVIDVAIKYGYNSADAFTRAFQELHGVTPSKSRMREQALKAYPRMSFQLTIQGGEEMNFRIEEKEAFRIIGIMKRVPIVFQGVNPEIAAMLGQLDVNTIRVLKEQSNVEPKGIISASTHFSDGRMEEKGELDHYIGVATTNECPPGFAALEVPPSTWAVFESMGPFPQTLQQTWGRIYSEWFPTSSYELAKGPEILWNEHPDTTSPTYKSEIWIPVVKRNL